MDRVTRCMQYSLIMMDEAAQRKIYFLIILDEAATKKKLMGKLIHLGEKLCGTVLQEVAYDTELIALVSWCWPI